MNVNQVRYFLAVATTKNFRRAAQQCEVAQPSVTNAIASLETEIGGDLFARTSTGWRKVPIELTDLGWALVPQFEQIADAATAIRVVALQIKATARPSTAA